MLMFNKIAFMIVSTFLMKLALLHDLKKNGICKLISYIFIKSNGDFFFFFFLQQQQITFLLIIKFIKCDKFSYDFQQLKLHDEKGSNFV